MDDEQAIEQPRVDDEEWKALTAERRAPVDGRGTPMNIIRRPLDLPAMEPVKGGPWPSSVDSG